MAPTSITSGTSVEGVGSGIRVANVTCAIDGASQETYKRYRVRGNYDRVIDNIRRVNHFKRTLGSELPHLSWQFIAIGHNQHEIPLARALAEELGMRLFYVKLSWDTDFSPLVDEDAVRAATEFGVASRTEYLEKHGSDYLGTMCMQLWKHPQINWDGKVLGCCRNFWGDFGGNAFRDGLIESLNHEKMLYAREMLEGKKPARPDIPCTTCELYTRRADVKQWFKSPPRRDINEKSIAEAWMSASSAVKSGDLLKAAQIARVLLQISPNDARALNVLGRVADAAGPPRSSLLLSRQGRFHWDDCTRPDHLSSLRNPVCRFAASAPALDRAGRSDSPRRSLRSTAPRRGCSASSARTAL